MPDLKLAKLPDRTPVKLSLVLAPNLAADLHIYAELYRERYGIEESLTELVPAMLAAFMESDKQFKRPRSA
ncbi:DUF2274 domain-containing protein [Sphingomonas sp. SRS2]|uniref:DUF2274 domain-containing protein n=1 Tax=Sphingomonas sp. SRS2 TaxID=133190 RepID=UPI0006184AF4|nr:DUF2274 domain-containing protein [Sphingomonas sp. SRS2]KKC23861.1 protein involved in integration/excision of ICE Tn4371 family [Sphingomonas sp. SRS2]